MGDWRWGVSKNPYDDVLLDIFRSALGNRNRFFDRMDIAHYEGFDPFGILFWQSGDNHIRGRATGGKQLQLREPKPTRKYALVDGHVLDSVEWNNRSDRCQQPFAVDDIALAQCVAPFAERLAPHQQLGEHKQQPRT